MSRSTHPDAERGHVKEHTHLVELEHPPHWRLLHTRGVFNALHATHARYHDPHLDTYIDWSSRKHRKGRRVTVRQVADSFLASITGPLLAEELAPRHSRCRGVPLLTGQRST